MKILMYKGQSGYDALRVFADETALNLEKMGHEVRVLDFREQGTINKLMDIYGRKTDFFPDIIFSMNGIEVDLRTADGRLLHNEMGVPFVSYIVDHPLYHHERLKTRLRDHHVICVNEGFEEYVKTYYRVKSTAVLMQAGLEPGENKDVALGILSRPYSVVFIGTYRGEREIEAQIDNSDPTVRNVSLCMLEELINNPGLRLEAGLDTALKKQGIGLKPAVFADTMNAMHLADKYVRAMYRKLAVKSLVQKGISVDVWGDNWDKLKPELTHPELLKVHEPVSYREAAKIYAKSKMVLNVMPWAKEGLHDRILTTMLAGAVCVTDETTTLVENWKDCSLIYSLSHLEKLPVMVKELLGNEKRMEELSKNGYEKAKSGHTWKERTKELEAILNAIR